MGAGVYPWLGGTIASHTLDYNGTYHHNQDEVTQWKTYIYLIILINYSKVWQLEAPAAGLQILLTFEAFELENPSHQDTCFDFVEISYDSYSQRYCGSSVPEPLTSTGSSMKVKFHTDSYEAFTGFRATWCVVKDNTTTALISVSGDICLVYLSTSI